MKYILSAVFAMVASMAMAASPFVEERVPALKDVPTQMFAYGSVCYSVGDPTNPDWPADTEILWEGFVDPKDPSRYAYLVVFTDSNVFAGFLYVAGREGLCMIERGVLTTANLEGNL